MINFNENFADAEFDAQIQLDTPQNERELLSYVGKRADEYTEYERVPTIKELEEILIDDFYAYEIPTFSWFLCKRLYEKYSLKKDARSLTIRTMLKILYDNWYDWINKYNHEADEEW